MFISFNCAPKPAPTSGGITPRAARESSRRRTSTCSPKAMRRRTSGVSLAEAAAALTLLLPLMMTVLYVVLESSYAYLIKNSMNEAVREAGRDLSIAYGEDPSISTDRTLQNSMVFDNIRITNMVNSSEQFSDPVWDTTSSPPTVSVTCTYLSNQYSLPPFPNPDPLQLGTTFTISATSSYRLE